jgi:uncharacterized protein (TIGR02145 family)
MIENIKKYLYRRDMKYQYKLIVILFLFLSGTVLSDMSIEIGRPFWNDNAPFVEEVTLKTITVHFLGYSLPGVLSCVDTLIIEDINLRVKRRDIKINPSGYGSPVRAGIILLPDTTETLRALFVQSYKFYWIKGGIYYPAVVDSAGWERFNNIVESFGKTPSSCVERGNRLGLGFGRANRQYQRHKLSEGLILLKRPMQPANATDTCSIFTDPRDNQAYRTVTTGNQTRMAQNLNNATDTCSIFTDPRDNQAYRTVTIGNQTWMAQNLNFDMDSSWCYDNSPDNCIKYGRLYEWDAAKRACPAGWRLPDNSDWNALVNAAGGRHTAGTKLKSILGWQVEDGISAHTDNFRFSALPGGFGAPNNSYHFAGSYGGWWSATEQDGSPLPKYGYAWYWSMNSYFAGVYLNWYFQEYGRSVRCLSERTLE